MNAQALAEITAPDDLVELDVRRATAGDGRAFARLYQRHVPRVYSLARRMAGVEHADELTQEIFLRAWRKLPTFRGRAAFGTWLHRLAVNLILSRRDRLRDLASREDELPPTLPAPAAAAPAHGRLDFEAALAKLPTAARQIFILHDVEGYTHAEVATTLGVAEGTSKSQLHRARMLLRRALTGGSPR